MRHFGPEPPWTTPVRYRDGQHKCSYGAWVEAEPLWDGTRVWEYAEAERLLTFLDLLNRVVPRLAMQTKVRWLEDEFLPGVKP